MARIRSLKIGFFQNESLCELSSWHRLLFEGLWVLADREGRLEDRPRRIKAELFPYDELDVETLLKDLAQRNFIWRYDADGVPAIAIVNFLKHQRPNVRESVSLIPAPICGKGSVLHVQGKGEGEWSLGSGLGKGEGEDADGASGADGAPPLALIPKSRVEDFVELWNTRTLPPIARCRELTSSRRRHVKARITERPLSEWADIFERIQRSAFCRGENDRGWRASFDWVSGSPDVAVKVLEGKYDDRKNGAPVKANPRILGGMTPWERMRRAGLLK